MPSVTPQTFVRLSSAALFALSVVGCMPPHHASEGHSSHEGGSLSDEHGAALGEHGEHADLPTVRRSYAPAVVAAASRVRVMPRSDLGCRTELLGLVDVHEGMGSTERALSEMKLRAAELGAEAVVGVDFEHGSGHAGPTHLSGMAVRCRDLVRGRAYDVVAEIEVPGDMGHEDDAFRRIKVKGREVHADLLIDVTFDHGESGRGPTKLRAKAIRFRPRATSEASRPRLQP